jgi:hypothetical protein
VLAKFFNVHPGYLVDDPEGYHVELQSDARMLEDKLDLWLVSGAERFRRDPELRQALLAVARHDESRRCLLMLRAVIDTPGLVDRLLDVLSTGGSTHTAAPARPVAPARPAPRAQSSAPAKRGKKSSREVEP